MNENAKYYALKKIPNLKNIDGIIVQATFTKRSQELPDVFPPALKWLVSLSIYFFFIISLDMDGKYNNTQYKNQIVSFSWEPCSIDRTEYIDRLSFFYFQPFLDPFCIRLCIKFFFLSDLIGDFVNIFLSPFFNFFSLISLKLKKLGLEYRCLFFFLDSFICTFYFLAVLGRNIWNVFELNANGFPSPSPSLITYFPIFLYFFLEGFCLCPLFDPPDL